MTKVDPNVVDGNMTVDTVPNQVAEAIQSLDDLAQQGEE